MEAGVDLRGRLAGWAGDLTTRWEKAPPTEWFADPVLADPVPVAVRSSLVGLLDAAGASLHLGGVIRRDGVRVELERPELWIAWLEHAGRWSAARAETTDVEGLR